MLLSKKGTVVIALPTTDAVADAERAESDAEQVPACGAVDPEHPSEDFCFAPDLCMARIWNSGLGKQCSHRKRPGSDFCGAEAHAMDSKREHGRIDEAVPTFMLKSTVKQRTASSGLENAPQPDPTVAAQQRAVL